MRQCLTILAVCGILAGPTLTAADDPFDFSGPLPTPGSRRSAQYFSRVDETDEAHDKLQLNGTAQTSSYRRATRPTTASQTTTSQPQSGATRSTEPARGLTADRPPSVSFGADMARERDSAAPRDPQETLRRFDEFLKTRDVVSAAYDEQGPGSKPSSIRQVQFQQNGAAEALPSFGDLDTLEPVKPATDAARPRRPLESLFNRDTPRTAWDKDSRLTDPIPTSPATFANPDSGSAPFDAGPFSPANESPTTATTSSTSSSTLNVGNFGQLTIPATGARPAGDSAEPTASADLRAPAIETHWQLLGPLNVGQECTAELTLTNSGERDADRVSLEVRVPQTVTIVQTQPSPVEQQAFLGWKLTGLAAGTSQTVRVTFITQAAGPLDLETHVRHTTSARSTYTVTQPMLELAVSGPSEVHVGEPATQTLLVKNPGTGVATNVTIEALIPQGLENPTGERLQMDIGSLNPGEIRSVRLIMGAVAGGDHIVQVRANADAGLVQTAAAEVSVIAPSLRTGIAGPSLRYVGREADYVVRVMNDGSAATDFVQVLYRLPDGFEFVRADRDAKYDPATRNLHWYVGRLESQESLDLRITLLSQTAGEFVHVVRATSDIGAQSEAKTTTRVEGAASLVVKVTDLDDPVEVGTETAYEVTITNEGTASARNVALICEIPPGMTFQRATGDSEHRLQGEMIGFRPVGELGAGESLSYRVVVTGNAPGDQRFRCRLSSESLTQPLFSEELTKFYAE